MGHTSTSTSNANHDTAPTGGLSGRSVLLAVGGGIAAYKVCELSRLLCKEGADVHVMMTDAAAELVGPTTFAALTGNPVGTKLFDAVSEVAMRHTDLGLGADLVVVAPATADLMARMAAGMGNDLVTTTLLVTDCQMLVCPAMNAQMWRNPLVQANVERLRALDRCFVLDPDEGDLACGVVGPGRLREPQEILEHARALCTPKVLTGRRLLVTGGPTREHVDDVRFLSNQATGSLAAKMCEAARDRGAEVTYVHGPGARVPAWGVEEVAVVSAEDLAGAVRIRAAAADAVLMCAAVADWTPTRPRAGKEPKSGESKALELRRTPDVLAELGAMAPNRPRLLGFAAQVEDRDAELVALGREKMQRKGCDMLFVNPVYRDGRGFGPGDTQGVLLGPGDAERPLGPTTKDQLAAVLVEAVADLLRDLPGDPDPKCGS